MIDKFDILVAGVGGQGAILTSRIIVTAALKDGFKVVSGEVHGMSQRGGSVSTHVRLGEKVYGPIIPLGTADILMGLELIEPLRYVAFISQQGNIIMSRKKTIPPTVWTIEGLKYPSDDEVTAAIKPFAKNLFVLDSVDIAEKAGSAMTANIVLLGTLTGIPGFPVSEKALLEAVKENVPPKALEANVKAFNLGAEEIKKLI